MDRGRGCLERKAGGKTKIKTDPKQNMAEAPAARVCRFCDYRKLI